MRHEVLPAVHPDALYASWNSAVYRAQTSTADGTVLLSAPVGAEPPEGFDLDVDGAPSKVVPGTEVPYKFAIHTYCRYADEIFVVAGQTEDGALTLRWTGQDQRMAKELGLVAEDGSTNFGTSAQPKDIVSLWQERHDFADTLPPRFEPASAEERDGAQREVLRNIARTLRDLRPEGGAGVAAQFRQVGDYSELEVRAVASEVSYSVAAPPRLSQMFSDLRAMMYQERVGTWFQGTLTLEADGTFEFAFDSQSQPGWRLPPDEGGRPTARAFTAELVRFPRDRDQVPPWLGARAGLPLDVEFHHALVFDEHTPGQRPVVNREPLPPREVRGVLDYLYKSPVVKVGDRPQPDLFAPQTAPSVPNAFHTDGSWIWPAAVPHYLRMHGVPPDPALLNQIRSNRYRPPFVSQRMRETAAAEVSGEPYPSQSAADLDEHDAITEVERDDSEQPNLRAGQVLTLLRKRLDELGIAREAYGIGEDVAEAWCLKRTPSGWQVAWHGAGKDWDVEQFSTVKAAGAFLLGALAFHPTRTLAAPDAAENPADWPIAPLRGEPPLTMFRGKRMVVLPPGTELLRHGNDAGNLLHEAGARFRETSLLPDRERQRAKYRVLRPLRVLTGVTLPFGGMPGGALAYLLPRAIGAHVQSGALEQVHEGASTPPSRPREPMRDGMPSQHSGALDGAQLDVAPPPPPRTPSAPGPVNGPGGPGVAGAGGAGGAGAGGSGVAPGGPGGPGAPAPVGPAGSVGATAGPAPAGTPAGAPGQGFPRRPEHAPADRGPAPA